MVTDLTLVRCCTGKATLGLQFCHISGLHFAVVQIEAVLWPLHLLPSLASTCPLLRSAVNESSF